MRVKNAEALEKAKAERHRKYNDRKNISSLIKWQNDNWMVKASYNHINRHLPDSLWGMEQVAFNGWDVGAGTDVYDHFFADSRKQTMDTYDLMLQNRQQHGRLEWGWFVDYQHQKKSIMLNINCTIHGTKMGKRFRNYKGIHQLIYGKILY